MRLTRRDFGILLGGTAAACATGAAAQGAMKVRIGQATPAVSFLPVMAARALGSFKQQNVDLDWAAIPGGDPTTLAALDAGDIDLAAVGSETALRAIGKGQPFQLVYSLMSKISLELVLSNDAIAKAGIKPTDPLDRRLKAMKGVTIGVSAVGGAQESAARWLAAQGGLNPKTDIQAALAGAPPAIQAALENKRVDGFVLSPPEGALAEDAGTGRIISRIGDDFGKRTAVPYLVLVAKTPVPEAKAPAIVATVKALQAASAQVIADPAAASTAIQQAFFPKIKPDVMKAAIEGLKGGVADGGRFSVQSIADLIAFIGEVGTNPGANLDPAKGETVFWTNRYVDAAKG